MAADSLLDRVETWADAREVRWGGCNPWSIAVRTVRSAAQDRVTGLAAEMAFFALLSLVPVIVALGAGLGLLERVVDPQSVERGRQVAIDAMAVVFSPRMTEDVLEPLVNSLLARERGGLALSSLLVSLWLASRVFMASIRALDQAYGVAERRGFVVLRLLALVFALAAVVVVSVTLVLFVVGPLLGLGREAAATIGLGDVAVRLWAFARWPLVFLVAIGFYVAVYRYGPNVANRWRDCLPGAVLGVSLWLLATVGFRVYLATVGEPGARYLEGQVEEGVVILGQVVGALVAAILWTYLTGLSLLVGGVLNSQIALSGCGPARAAAPPRSA